MHAVDINSQKKPQDFKNGHQTILKTFVRDKTLIEIEFTDGIKQRGRVTQFDNYTITLMRIGVQSQTMSDVLKNGKVESILHEEGYRTYFKSCIKGFGAANV
jgi:sRNA-binding regulator protein Hfq